MIATLWFLVKTCFLIAVFALILGIGGTVTIEFSAYSLSTTIGVFAIALFVSLWLVSVIGRFLYLVVSAPANMLALTEERSHRKGLQALAYGLSAIAAGDVKAASHYTKRVVKYLKKDDYGLSDLMAGLTARMKGDDTQVNRSFHGLMMHKETSFLGLKGLLQTAMEKRDDRYALILAEKAYAQHPDQPWILKTLYDLRIRMGKYGEAFDMIKVMEKHDLMNKDDAPFERAALLLGQGKIDKAYKLAPLSLPVALEVLAQWGEEGKRRKSLSLIRKLWIKNPHPDVMDYWVKYAPKKAVNSPVSMMAWVEELYRENPDDASSALYAGEVLMHMGQKDQAKRFIRQAIAEKTTVSGCQLMYRIEGDNVWAEQAANAIHDKTWVCNKTGHVNGKWKIVSNDGYFNSVVWDYPETVKIIPEKQVSPFLLAA